VATAASAIAVVRSISTLLVWMLDRIL